MSAPAKGNDEPPIEHKDELVEYIAAGCKPPEEYVVGTEHEKFVFRKRDCSRPAYDAPDGIRALLEGLTRFGWEPVHEGDQLVALSRPDGASVTLEPGGQLELSGAKLRTLHETCSEVHEHLDHCRTVGDELGVGMIGIGFDPKWRREDVPWMPKARYGIMRRYMPTKGKHGIDMMLRTCTVQTNLDYSSEQDMIDKVRVSVALQPIATAMFANSPFLEGKPNGYMSFRSYAWTDTDPDRCGMLPFVFDDDFGFERYVDYALDVPMYFVYRDGHYVDAAGQSFRDFMNGELPALPGELPTLDDFEDHLTTIFPEVRIKRFIEQRGADGGPWRRLCALPALWVGLLYDTRALDEARALISEWTDEDREQLRRDVPRYGLAATFARFQPGGTVRDVAARILEIARAGLDRRGYRDWMQRSESHFLETLERTVENGESPAAIKLRQYHEDWDENIDKLYEQYAY